MAPKGNLNIVMYLLNNAPFSPNSLPPPKISVLQSVVSDIVVSRKTLPTYISVKTYLEKSRYPK